MFSVVVMSPVYLNSLNSDLFETKDNSALAHEFASVGSAAQEEDVNRQERDVEQTNNEGKLIFLLMLGTAGLTWMVSTAAQELWRHEKQMRREDPHQKPKI